MANCKHQILVENFTKQKMTSSKWPKTIVINKTNMKLLIVMWNRNDEQKACEADHVIQIHVCCLW